MAFPIGQGTERAWRRCGRLASCYLVIVWLPILPAAAGPWAKGADFSAVSTTSLPDSPEADNLLRVACDAVERKDWKVAVDSLQRLIDGSSGLLVSTDGRHFESARERATRLIGSLPAEGLRAYRILHDAEAAALLARAREAHDSRAVREVADRFFMTSSGDDACDLLAAWLIDAGRAYEALELIQRVLVQYPDTDIPAAMLLARRVIAERESGLARTSVESLEEFVALASRDARLGPLGERLEKYVVESRRRSDEAEGRGAGGGDPAWRSLLGSAQQAGVMPGLSPSLLGFGRWEYSLPGEGTAPAVRLNQQQVKLRAYPAFYGVTDGRRLFVRSEQQVVALDPDSMQEMWRTRRVTDSLIRATAELDYGFSVAAAFRGGRLERVRDRRGQVFRTMLDELSASLTSIGDIVLTVDRYGHSEYEVQDAGLVVKGDDSAEAVGGGPAPARGFGGARSGAFDTRLVALDALTGRVRWSRGRSGDSRDPLGAGTFAGPPVDLGDSMAVPFREGSEVYLVRLAMEDGRMLDKRYLCSQERDASVGLWSMHSVRAGNMLYVPLGGGFVMALRTDPLRPLWATAYEVVKGARERESSLLGTAQRWGWLSGPPVVAGPVVICTPRDSDELIAFDRMSGSIVWRIARGGHRYILGSDGRVVWLGGSQISAVEASSGLVLWKAQVKNTTGRGAVSTGRILIPTADGLVELDARTGEVLERKSTPAEGGLLGNLLCWSGAVYSVETRGVRKFPDLGLHYERVLERGRRDPNDAGVMLRLAWLEAMKNNPQGVIDSLAKIRPMDRRLDPQRRGQVHHLRSEAYLSLAERESGGGAIVGEHLKRALEQAVTARDVARARLRLAEYSMREGRMVEAYRRYVSVLDPLPDPRGARGLPDELMIKVSDEWHRLLSSVAADGLDDVWGLLTAEARGELGAEYGAALDGAMRGGDLETVRRFAGLGLPGGVGERALLHLAERARGSRRYELAEGYYLRVIRKGREAANIGRALAELSAMYLEPGQHLFGSAAELLGRLESEYAGTAIDVSFEGIGEAGSDLAERVAGRLRERMGEDVAGGDFGTLSDQESPIHNDAAWRIAVDSRTRLVGFGEAAPEAAREAVLLLVGDSELQRIDLLSGKPEWPARLEVLERLPRADGRRDLPAIFGGTQGRRAFRAQPARARSDGQTMVLASPIGIHAVGIRTGRSMWAKPVTPADPSLAPASGIPTSEANGLYAGIVAPGRIQVMQTFDGTVLWERRTTRDDFWGVSVLGGRVYAIDRSGENVRVYDAESGEQSGRLRFSYAEGEPRVSVAVFDTVACGPQGETIVAYDLATGAETWRLDPEEVVTGLFKPRDDLLGVGTRYGGCILLEAATGRRVLEVRLEGFDGGVRDGSLDGNVLCLRGERRSGDGSVRLVLAGVDVGTGRVVWSEGDLPSRIDLANTVVLPRMVTRFRHLIPLYEYPEGMQRGGRRLAGATPDVRLTFISKRTGKPVAPAIEFEADSPAVYVPDVRVHSGFVIILTNKYLRVFGRGRGNGAQARAAGDHPTNAALWGAAGAAGP